MHYVLCPYSMWYTTVPRTILCRPWTQPSAVWPPKVNLFVLGNGQKSWCPRTPCTLFQSSALNRLRRGWRTGLGAIHEYQGIYTQIFCDSHSSSWTSTHNCEWTELSSMLYYLWPISYLLVTLMLSFMCAWCVMCDMSSQVTTYTSRLEGDFAHSSHQCTSDRWQQLFWRESITYGPASPLFT